MQQPYSKDVITISAISCILSIVGGAVIFATFITIKEIRNFARKLVVCLTVADVISAAAYLVSVFKYANVGAEEESVLCKIQSFCTTYSSIVSFLLTSVIAIYIFDTVIHEKDRLGSTLWLFWFNVISWTTPGVVAVSALATKGVLGSDQTEAAGTGPWCWVSTNATNSVMWMVVAGKGWEIACYLITTSLYVLLLLHLFLHRKRRKFKTVRSLRDEDKNFLYVWFLLYVLRVWGTIRFFLYALLGSSPSDDQRYMGVLLRLQAFGDPGQAFGNSFLFCVLDKTVRTKLKQVLCCRRQEDDSERSNLLDEKDKINCGLSIEPPR